jgi:hypothetical protein
MSDQLDGLFTLLATFALGIYTWVGWTIFTSGMFLPNGQWYRDAATILGAILGGLIGARYRFKRFRVIILIGAATGLLCGGLSLIFP